MPTAIPYIAGLVAVVESRRDVLERVLLVLLYNVVFVLPLVAIMLLALLAGPKADARMLQLRLRLERYAPTAIPVVVAIVGLLLLAYGARAL